MIILSNTTAQTLQPGQSITFNNVVMHTGKAECHRANTTSVKLREFGIYEVSFGGNVSSASIGNIATINIQVGGESLPETTIESTAAAANAFENVFTTTLIKNCCCDYDRVTVTNTGTTAFTIDANPCLKVKRVS